jgi:hypothetical protein
MRKRPALEQSSNGKCPAATGPFEQASDKSKTPAVTILNCSDRIVDRDGHERDDQRCHFTASGATRPSSEAKQGKECDGPLVRKPTAFPQTDMHDTPDLHVRSYYESLLPRVLFGGF